MITAYENILEEKRKDFFDKYGIRPKKSHEDCLRYITCMDYKWCSKNPNGKLDSKCSNVKNIYPEIDSDKLLELIVIASGLFPVSFAFERGKADIEDIVLSSLINYADEQGIARREIRKLFGRRS